jgi:hypothetical protein
MRAINKYLLILNAVVLLFIVLWLLVGGSRRGYYGGGAASEVDGILLLILSVFNVAYLTTVFVVLAQSTRARAGEVLGEEVFRDEDRLRLFMRGWSQWALIINGVLILFVGLWLLVSSGRWNYFLANATEVDMVLLLVLTFFNLAYMGVAFLQFSRPVKRQS